MQSQVFLRHTPGCGTGVNRQVRHVGRASAFGNTFTRLILQSSQCGCSVSTLEASNKARRVSGRRAAARNAARAASASQKLTVAVTGATGLVGTRLVQRLAREGHNVRVLTRDVGNAKDKLRSRNTQFYGPRSWSEAVSGASGVINLAGEPISTRWTNTVKREIKRSRIETTRALVAAINACPKNRRPKVLVSTSAVGFYGTSETQTFSEASAAGNDYLAEVCREWEAQASKADVDRVVILRTGIVLAKEGGAVGKMLPVFKLFAGGPLGTGQQWCSWIHRDDLVSLYMEALTNSAFRGSYNATAPNPVRMAELCSVLGSRLGRPSWLPVPSFAISALLGAGASVVLEGQKVLPKKTLENGFEFQYSKLDPAISNILAGS
ncbi:hypothetical protein WJX73_006995 [Symbiochloris irregularis]|uniref:Uncharacterized protein n=1 Tax=Symbiochloris irregularis TaxID=706552 RepID=A0AAW1NV93_9CHLO